MTTCPICDRPVDPLRARAVGVRDGKVVGYCSAECASKADAAGTPAAGVPTKPATPAAFVDSGPVIEIVREPASGVVAAPVAKSDTRTAKSAKATAKLDEPKPAQDAPANADESKAARAGSAKGDGPAKQAAVPAAASPAVPAAPVVAAASIAPGKRRPGKLTMQRDSNAGKAAWDWIDEEPAQNPGAELASDASDASGVGQGRSRTIVTGLVVLALLGGGSYLAFRYFNRDHAATSHESTDEPAALVPGSVEAVAPTPTPELEPDKVAVDAALDRARAVLRGFVDSKSARVQRVAAEALARTGDPAAIEVLAKALAQPRLDPAGKLAVAYALARGGDKRGSDVLVAALTAPSREDRLTAGRLLAQLGDKRAVAIATYLDVEQHRLSVAEQLARLADPNAIKALEAIRVDPKSTPDAIARATIALGLAGESEVTPALHKLLADSRNNVYAAEALAMRHDEAARPVLEKLLEMSTLRVRAARGLRRLSPTLDATPYLPALLTALGTPGDPDKKDTVQIEVAETILLLTGPAAWSERH